MNYREKMVTYLFLVAFLPLIACSSNDKNKDAHKQHSDRGQKKSSDSTEKYTVENKDVVSYTTAKGRDLRLSKKEEHFKFNDSMAQPKENEVAVFVNPNKKFQKFYGIGGAVTDATAETFAKLPESRQEEFLKAYFSKDGLNYTVIRTTMNSSDFSSESYVYVEDNDEKLETFNVEHDEKYKIPLLKKIQDSIGDSMILYFSPWTAPAWMKSNDDLLNGGTLLPEYYQTWADYYVKFIKAYEKRDLPIWGLTVQNEPMAVQTWESMTYTAKQERDFLRDYLGPTLEKNGMDDKKIMIWDHNRDLIYQRASTILSDPEAAKYVWGIGFHWYETWTGSAPMFDNVRRTYESYPDYKLVFTEGTKEDFDYNKIDDWSLGELYGRNMINDFNNGLTMWTDWNMMVDEKGGPNHLENYCFAPIIGNTKTDELLFTNEYYYIGQISKFVQKGARRVGVSTNRDFMLSTSFMNKDGSLIVVVMNESDKDTDYFLWISGKMTKVKAMANSIETFVFN